MSMWHEWGHHMLGIVLMILLLEGRVILRRVCWRQSPWVEQTLEAALPPFVARDSHCRHLIA